MEKDYLGHKVTVLGAISGATAYWPPLPPYRVGNMLYFIYVGSRWV